MPAILEARRSIFCFRETDRWTFLLASYKTFRIMWWRIEDEPVACVFAYEVAIRSRA
jgi:hypothetical protein